MSQIRISLKELFKDDNIKNALLEEVEELRLQGEIPDNEAEEKKVIFENNLRRLEEEIVKVVKDWIEEFNEKLKELDSDSISKEGDDILIIIDVNPEEILKEIYNVFSDLRREAYPFEKVETV